MRIGVFSAYKTSEFRRAKVSQQNIYRNNVSHRISNYEDTYLPIFLYDNFKLLFSKIVNGNQKKIQKKLQKSNFQVRFFYNL